MENIEKGKIVYRFSTPVYPENIIYANVIPKYACTNNCIFCSRPKTPDETGKGNIYEKKACTSLFLPKSPSADTVIKLIEKEIKHNDKEIAFVGLGEPLIYLLLVCKIIRKIKKKHRIKTRVDTNGLAECMYKNPAKMLKDAGLDEIRVSLNATDKDYYEKLCRPRFHNSFENLISFIKNCLKEGISTYVSFITDFDNGKIKSKTDKEYTDFALSLGIKKENIILRKYVKLL